MEFTEYLVKEALILVPVLVFIGWMIKNAAYVNDKHIPVILLVCGIVGAGALMGFTVDGVIQGILVAAAAVFSNQIYKQRKE